MADGARQPSLRSLGIVDPRGTGNLYWQHKGAKVSLRTRDPAVARIRVAELQRQEADPAYGAAQSFAVGEACSEWLAWRQLGVSGKQPSAATVEMYELHLGHFVRLFGEERPIGEINAAVVDRYISTRLSETIKNTDRTVQLSTVAKEIGTLRQILRLGLRRGWYHLPLERVIPEISVDYKPLKRHLTIDQVWALLAELPWHRAAVVAYIVALGADWGAVWRAAAEDFGPPSFFELLPLVRGSKNATRLDHVPVVPPFGPLAMIARGWLLAHGRFEPWKKENCREMLERACRRAGLPRVTARDLRRSHGKALSARGVPPYLIGPMLRHVDGRMAERVYAVPERLDVRTQVAAITSKA